MRNSWTHTYENPILTLINLLTQQSQIFLCVPFKYVENVVHKVILLNREL